MQEYLQFLLFEFKEWREYISGQSREKMSVGKLAGSISPRLRLDPVCPARPRSFFCCIDHKEKVCKYSICYSNSQ